MTVNYQYNNFHTCIRISKNKKKIENKIKEIQREYRGMGSNGYATTNNDK